MRRSNVALRLQTSLLEEAKRVAESEGVALNQLINVAVAEQLRAGRTVRHWVRLLKDAPEDEVLLRQRLVQEEAALIRQWNLRQTGWNRG